MGSHHIFPPTFGGSDGKESACSAGDPGSIPGLGSSPVEGSGYPLQYSCWRIPWTEEPGPWGHKQLETTEPIFTHLLLLSNLEYFLHEVFSDHMLETLFFSESLFNWHHFIIYCHVLCIYFVAALYYAYVFTSHVILRLFRIGVIF